MTSPKPKVVSLPVVSRMTGASLDAMRENAHELAAAGLIFKVGNYWAAFADDAEAIAARVRKPARTPYMPPAPAMA